MFLQFYLCFFTSLFTLSESSNHWIVTEEGRIKSQVCMSFIINFLYFLEWFSL